ncbi:MAG TPA: PQQ-dependent sugar dehydrogenase [Dehalococcoidia bacterium]
MAFRTTAGTGARRARTPGGPGRLWLLAALVMLLAACGGSGPDGTPTPESASGGVTETPTPSGPVRFRVETVATGLDTPWELAFAPDGRIFVTERPGRVRVVRDGRLLPEPAVTIDEVAEEGEGGLLGLALAPDFPRSRAVYVYYTEAAGGGLRNRVVRYTEANDRLTDPVVILDGIPGARIHDGGRIAFGPDGKLYVTAGDAAQQDLAQDVGSLAGKILRLNPDGSIPADNPFPGSPVYSYGHRNPQGLAWQPGTGQLYATEHGPSAHDEVNRIQPGANYGWPAMQGNAGQTDGFTRPVIESGAGTTWAPSGAAFVAGDRFPQLRGDLVFAGLRSTSLWRLRLPADGGEPQLEALIEGEYGRLRNVVQGPDGSLYVLTNNRDGRGNPGPEDDRILRLAPEG